jgi:glycosyltransferase involved in cell wall biosynthesis
MIERVIVVDDGSHDETAVIAAKKGAQVIRHAENKGYGAAVKTGIRSASSSYILIMDADAQHRTVDVEHLWAKSKEWDMVVGARTNNFHSPLWRAPGKFILSHLVNFLLDRKIPDFNSGFRMIKRDVALKYLHICPQGFSFSTTITMALISRGYEVGYVPIQAKRRIGRSTVHPGTGFNTMILILRIAALFNPLRIFVPLSLFLFVIGSVWGVPYILKGNGISIGALLAFLTAVIVFAIGILCDQIAQLRLERFE